VSDRQFTRGRIIAALQALGAELTSVGIRGQVFIVGGAAMALAYSTRRVTRDIDAVFEPKTAIYQAAERVAERLQLPEDWLNDGVKGFLPGADRDAVPLPEVDGIEVTTASPRYLLAMKLLAMRFGEDDDDIGILLRQTGIRTPHEALALLVRMYPNHGPPAKRGCSSRRSSVATETDRPIRSPARELRHALHHREQFVAPVPVAMSQVDQLRHLGHDDAVLWRSGDGDRPTAPDVQEPLVAQHP
jgi:hypothetical protein